MHFEKKVDLRSRAAMIGFLTGHERYNTMNSWNGSSSYAHCVKLHQLGLTNEQHDKAYEVLDTDYWNQIDHPIQEFTQKMNGRYTIGSNGRSSGYLVLYNSVYENSQYRSHCRSCGQGNFKTALIPDSTYEGVIMAAVLRNGGCWIASEYLNVPEVAALNLFEEQKMLAIHKAKSAAKDSTLGNKCGRCHAEGERGRVNYAKVPQVLNTYPGQSIDQGESFSDTEEWTMESLRDRVALVQAFDQVCDEIRDCFISLLEDCDVVEEIIMVPKTRKVLQCLSGAA